jgi:hypothetical protein
MLKSRISTATPYGAECKRIVALVGDGHTFLRQPRDAANLPIEIARFGENYRISSVAAGLENALGGRVLKVHDTPISRAAELILPLAARDEKPASGAVFRRRRPLDRRHLARESA